MEPEPIVFDTVDRGDAGGAAPVVRPWKSVAADPEYAGAWVVTGDVDGDGRVEIVSARNVNRGDVHHTSAVVAQDLDGRVLWRWGDPSVGRRALHHDVACQIHDWDGDGRAEVILCHERHLVELDGATGAERRRLPIPEEASDCLVFADLAGRGRAAEVLIKTRYERIWALDYAGNLFWTVENPGGYRTAHQPFPLDIDGDGREEIMAGYALLDPDGGVRWVLPDAAGFEPPGHLDCCRVVRRGDRPADWRLVLSCCGAGRLTAVDGLGARVWEIPGHHFESIDVGRVFPDRPGAQILVDIVPPGRGSPEPGYSLWILDEEGRLLGRIMTGYGRLHTLADLNGDGIDEIVLPSSRGVFDRRGERIATLDVGIPARAAGAAKTADDGDMLLHGDMDGDGVSDLTVTTPRSVCVFRCPGTPSAGPRPPLGCGPNRTLY